MDIRSKVGVVIIDDQDNILLLKEKIKKKGVPLWNTVKGTYGDNGDENIFEAAVRECLEETSTDVELTNSLGCYISKKEDKLRIQFNFLAKIKNGEPKLPRANDQQSRDEAISELKWFTEDEILKMNSDEFMSNRTHKLLTDYISGTKFPLEAYKQVSM